MLIYLYMCFLLFTCCVSIGICFIGDFRARVTMLPGTAVVVLLTIDFHDPFFLASLVSYKEDLFKALVK